MFLVLARYTMDDVPVALWPTRKEAELFCEVATNEQIHNVACDICCLDCSMSNLTALSIVAFDGPRPGPAECAREFNE